jgi:cholestenol Delta-isomerase
MYSRPAKQMISCTNRTVQYQFTWGPLCFTVAALITVDHPLRHPLQIIVSVGQIYGLILYYATSMFDHYYKGVAYSRPEFLYFWVYYFFMNFIWMVFPGSKFARHPTVPWIRDSPFSSIVLLYSSVSKIARAFKTLEKLNITLQSNNAIKSNGAAKSTKKTI